MIINGEEEKLRPHFSEAVIEKEAVHSFIDQTKVCVNVLCQTADEPGANLISIY